MLNFVYYNPNPRGCITGDCVKRAISVAADIDYRELELVMRRTKLSKNLPYNAVPNYEHTIEFLGGVAINMKTPSGMDMWHIQTIDKIINQYPHVRYVLRVSKHLIGIKEEAMWDLYDSTPRNKSIYKMYIFGATPQEVAEIQRLCSKGPGYGRFIL